MLNYKKLPEMLKHTLDVVKQISGTTDEMVLPAVLAVMNLVSMTQTKVNPVLWAPNGIPINLYFLVIAPTGVRKSSLYETLLEGVVKWRNKLKMDYPALKQTYDLNMDIYKKLHAKYVANAVNPNTSAKTLASIINKPTLPPPLQSIDITTTKGTVNGLIKPLITQPYIGLFSDEAGDFFKGHSFQGGKDLSKSLELSAFLTKCFAGTTVDKFTGMETVQLDGRLVSMLFLLQPIMISDFLNISQYSDQGFIHRLLISHCEKLKDQPFDSSKKYLDMLHGLYASLQGFHDRVYELLSKPPKIKSDDDFELDLPIMSLDKKAKTLLTKHGNAYKIFKFEDPKWQDFTLRAMEFAVRLAATLAVFDGKTEIDSFYMNAGIEIFNFFVEQRETMTSDTVVEEPEMVRDKERIIKWMIKKGFDGLLSQLWRTGPVRARTVGAKQLDKLEKELDRDDRIEFYDDKGKICIKLSKEE